MWWMQTRFDDLHWYCVVFLFDGRRTSVVGSSCMVARGRSRSKNMGDRRNMDNDWQGFGFRTDTSMRHAFENSDGQNRMDAGCGRDHRFLVMDKMNARSSPTPNSAAVYPDPERGTRLQWHPTTRFLNGILSWTRSYHNSFSWKRWTQKSRGVLFLGPDRRRDIGIHSTTQVIPGHCSSRRW